MSDPSPSITPLSPQALARILTGTSVRQLIADGVPAEEIPEPLRGTWHALVATADEFDQIAAEFGTELAALIAKETTDA